jgi:hypothetical protein
MEGELRITSGLYRPRRLLVPRQAQERACLGCPHQSAPTRKWLAKTAKHGLIAMFKGRLGQLQRQCHYAFIAYGGEAKTSQLSEYCRPWSIIEGKPTRVQIASHARAARSIGAYRVRRERQQWLWRLKG